jgi:glycosyltransferase involved in cell wall biosynthesis
MGYAADKVHTVLNSLDMQGWDCALDGSAVRAEFGIAPEDPLLATVSRLFSWKGHTELLKALAIVHQRVSNVRLLIVGEDDPRAHPRQGAYSVELKALARELGLSDAVIFAGHRKDVPRILAACDVYAMPSFEEPFGMVFLEAMAMKKPVVALNNGGTPEVVQHGQSGLLSQPYVIEELAANILTLLHNPDLRRFMGERGRMRVAESFNPRRMATDCERIYWQLKGRSVPVSESQATRSLQGG